MLLLILFGCISSGEAQDLITDIPASASIWSNVFISPSAAMINPAALGASPAANIIILSKRPYFIKGLSDIQLQAVFPVAIHGGLFIGCRRFGNSNYTDLTVSTGYGMRLNKRMQLGIALHYSGRKAGNFRQANALLPMASFQLNQKNYSAGIFCQYQVLTRFSHLTPGWITGFGVGKDWSAQLYTDLNVFYGKGTGINTMVSLQYKVLDAWRIVIRCQTHPLRYGFETGYRKNGISLRVCSDWHPQLGFSPGLMLGYSPKSIN